MISAEADVENPPEERPPEGSCLSCANPVEDCTCESETPVRYERLGILSSTAGDFLDRIERAVRS